MVPMEERDVMTQDEFEERVVKLSMLVYQQLKPAEQIMGVEAFTEMFKSVSEKLPEIIERIKGKSNPSGTLEQTDVVFGKGNFSTNYNPYDMRERTSSLDWNNMDMVELSHKSHGWHFIATAVTVGLLTLDDRLPGNGKITITKYQ